MIGYRPFLNCDPPAIAEIWSSQPPSRGLMQPMTSAILDQLVLSKPYFDREGLVIAVENDRPIGFAHAGFGPNAERSGLSHELGITCLLMVVPHLRQVEIATELLKRSEEYLQGGGAQKLYGGGYQEPAPFYLGLYGGSGSPGVLNSDTTQLEAYRAAGYEEEQRTCVYHRELADFRPIVDRKLVQLKRQLQVEVTPDPMPANWWDACTFGQIDCTRFVLAPRKGGPARGGAIFWDIEPMASSWGVHAMGLLQLSLYDQQDEHERVHHTIFFLGEAIRQLQSFGVTLVEVQVNSQDHLLIGVCQKLGFREVNQGIRFRKLR